MKIKSCDYGMFKGNCSIINLVGDTLKMLGVNFTFNNQQVGQLLFPSHTEYGNRAFSIFNDPQIVSIFQNDEGRHLLI